MLKIKVILSLFLIQQFGSLHSQSETRKINFLLQYANRNIQLKDSIFETLDSNQLSIHVLRFYVSKIRFLKNKRVVFEEKNSFHLLDASLSESLLIETKNPHFEADELEFFVGIDSLLNVSGAMSGDLDPTKGMYWTWQSGYINFKLEGESKLCKTRNNQYQFHIGGYCSPNYALTTIILPIPDSKSIQVKFDIEKLFHVIDLSLKNLIMSPCAEAVDFSRKLSLCFSSFNL